MNRRERMRAVVERRIPDRPPVGMWYHYPSKLSAAEAADAHWNYVKETDLDLIKIMYDNPYQLDIKITKPSDWFHIKPEGTTNQYFKKQVEILKRLLDKAQGDYPVWMTMFGPFKFAVMAESDELCMSHAKEHPGALKSGVAAIADSLFEWANGYLDAGADAIFYAAQFGEPGRFTRDQWENFVKPYDLKVMSAAEPRLDKYNVLHLCGEPEYGFKVHIDRFAGYPGAVVNWAIHQNGYELYRGRDFFARPVMGGLDNHVVMAKGSKEEITAEVNKILGENKGYPFMLGANCSIESPDNTWRVKAAVDAAKAFKG